MSKWRLQLNTEGVRQILTSKEMQAKCMDAAYKTANNYGSGATVYSMTYPERVGAAVLAEKGDSSNDLLRSLQS